MTALITTMDILMSDLRSLIRLQTWLSPAFPTGAFTYSSGLEAASASGYVTDGETLLEWLEGLITSGSGWNDCVLLAESWRRVRSGEDLEELANLAEALCISQTRHLETTAQGEAFLNAAQAWGNAGIPTTCPLPVAIGSVAGTHGIGLEETLTAYLHATVSNQIQASLRLVKLGQQGGVNLLAKLESEIINRAIEASQSTLNDLGSNTFIADIASMNHETLESRIFRS